MNRPWMPFHTRDWLDSKELRRCAPESRAVLADLMCLAHEGEPYGHLADKVGPLTDDYMSSRCVIPVVRFRRAVIDLVKHERLHEKAGVYFVRRMVEDEDIRLRRASGGKASIGHPNTHPPKTKEGYPSVDPSTHPSLKIDSRAGALAGSGSDSKKEKNSSGAQIPNDSEQRIRRLANEAPDPQDFEPGVQLAFQELLSSVNPASALATMEENIPLWWAAMRDGRAKPKRLRWMIPDGDYLRKPRAAVKAKTEVPREQLGEAHQLYVDPWAHLKGTDGKA